MTQSAYVSKGKARVIRVDEFGFLRVPLPDRYQAPGDWRWDQFGFHYDPRTNEVVRSIRRPYKGKHYGARSQIEGAVKRYRSYYLDSVPPVAENPVAKPCGNTRRVAREMMDVFARGSWDPFVAYSEGYEYWAYAGRLCNEYGIESKPLRRALQSLAFERWERFKKMDYQDYAQEYQRRATSPSAPVAVPA
jgi:hypothetical protein